MKNILKKISIVLVSYNSSLKIKKFIKKIPKETNSNNVMKNGILIGCHHGLREADLNFIIKAFKEFIKKFN